MAQSHLGQLCCLSLDQLGQNYRRYRLPDPQAETDLVASLSRYGQLTPVVVCLREETHQILDGFKRHAAATTLGWKALGARLYEADERAAKAAIYGLNQTGRHTQEWEDAWIVHALVRDDGLTQVEVAELLGRHKSWVCRRLALVEKLAGAAREDLRLGLLSATAARSLVRLPAGNQTELLATFHRDELTAAELAGVVELLGVTSGRSQQEYILAQPRQALQQARHAGGWSWDPRLSRAGNRLSRQLGQLLDSLARMESWLRHPGRADLSAVDRRLLAGAFTRLARDAHSVAVLAEDLNGEWAPHERSDAQ